MATDFRVQVMNFAGKSVRRKPFRHCVRIQKCPVNVFRCRAQNSMKERIVFA